MQKLSDPDTDTDKIGFIILRCVKSSLHGQYWPECYNCIRKFYPENKIIIIDDNSNYEFISNIELYKTSIIKSEYPRRAELLPYLYYLKNKFFDTAVIIHDSVFVNKYIDMRVNKYKRIWEFESTVPCSGAANEIKMILSFNDTELFEFYKNKPCWTACFGGMSIIRHDFLVQVNNKYDLNKLIKFVVNRKTRMAFERVIGCLLHKVGGEKETLLGNILTYWKRHGYPPQTHKVITFKNKNTYNLPFHKIRSGR